ncbi:HlyD family efflux transporter periplasmic adaptor subunit [Paraflavitalea sp. CAU 1676]|uniref:HlyD family secretion protein n=1 Tax=Paraflavitalea sp. CAU 1676 TaxID=3032598 RepID=UPI0023DA3E48|nr:HlyD family efflux transporter periplasmic adaptor subunit [Paraflavitalea sp. CAU 1676]MDF2187540.1 HlyD family efflux transporter periplasmic adaptor subunit [Paraflavitalea sp. CAU 1676]
MPRIFPAEMMQDSAYAWLPRVQPKSQIIYTLVLGAVVAALIASIFIKVDVSVNVPGIIRPITEKSELRSLTSASISKVHVQEGEHVTAGQLLLSLKQEVTDNKLDQAGFELSQRETHMHDLALLAKGAGPARLYTNLYKQQYIGFQAGMAEKRSILDKLKSDFQMYNKLYEEKVIAKKEFIEKKYAYEQARASYQAAIAAQHSQWQQELEKLRLEARNLQAGKKQLQREKEMLEIRAPVSGTVQQFNGRYEGGAVQNGELLGYISPDSGMVAEVYVSPQDIGYIQNGMPVKCQIDAFNYNSWGILPGKVLSVDNDFSVVNNNTSFKVKCILDKSYLELSNGIKGNLKKGMTLQCRFILARRGMLQLLYERADSWLNPHASPVAAQ